MLFKLPHTQLLEASLKKNKPTIPPAPNHTVYASQKGKYTFKMRKSYWKQVIYYLPFFGIGENPDVLSKLGAPSGTRPLACAFASSIANFFFSTLLSRSDKSTCEHRSTAYDKT